MIAMVHFYNKVLNLCTRHSILWSKNFIKRLGYLIKSKKYYINEKIYEIKEFARANLHNKIFDLCTKTLILWSKNFKKQISLLNKVKNSLNK